jgi:hypothetical protein
MNMPDEQELQDATWQVDYASQKLGPFLQVLQAKAATPPTDPAQRPAYERNLAFLRALEFFFQVNAHLIDLLGQRETQMNEEMQRARFRYNQMGIERDFFQAEARSLSTRYYAENDVFNELLQRLTTNGHA